MCIQTSLKMLNMSGVGRSAHAHTIPKIVMLARIVRVYAEWPTPDMINNQRGAPLIAHQVVLRGSDPESNRAVLGFHFPQLSHCSIPALTFRWPLA